MTKRIEHVVAVLQIDSYQAAVEFYVEKLGFEIQMEHRHEPGFPVFMVVKRGELVFALSEHGKGHPGTELYVYVDDVQDWYQRCLQNDINNLLPPDKKPWGNTEMAITDPFRNLLRITQVDTHEGKSTPNK